MVAGLYQHKPPLPFIPGLEAAGTVSEVGDGADGAFAPGDKVMVALRQGGYAEEAVVAPEQAMPLPAGFSFAEGATFRAAYGTAHHALVDRARLQAGETLLVHGAGGGVGLAAVEIGKLLGAAVIAAASREAKLEVARARGDMRNLPIPNSIPPQNAVFAADALLDACEAAVHILPLVRSGDCYKAQDDKFAEAVSEAREQWYPEKKRVFTSPLS